MFIEWTSIIGQSLVNIWYGFIGIVPQIIVAVIVFAIGWLIGAIIMRAIVSLFKALKIDEALKAAGLEGVVRRSGYDLNSGKFLGELVKWFIIVVFLVAAFNIVGLNDVNLFLQGVVLSYLPQVIIAVLMLLVSVIVAGAAQKLVIASAKAADVSHANLLGSVTKWAIWVFAILTVLYQLGIAAPIIQTIITGVVFALALALGLSFGLGGRDAARDAIEKVKSDIAHH